MEERFWCAEMYHSCANSKGERPTTVEGFEAHQPLQCAT
jgi:hypothetical protein